MRSMRQDIPKHLTFEAALPEPTCTSGSSIRVLHMQEEIVEDSSVQGTYEAIPFRW